MDEVYIVESWEDGSNDPAIHEGAFRSYDSAYMAAMAVKVFDEEADWEPVFKANTREDIYWSWKDGHHMVSIIRHEVKP